MLLWMGPLNRAFVCLFYTTQDPEREEERERDGQWTGCGAFLFDLTFGLKVSTSSPLIAVSLPHPSHVHKPERLF